MWSSLYDSFNRDSIHINSIILKSNSLYRIKGFFNSSSGDSSQMASKSFKTVDVSNIKLLTSLNRLVVTEDITLRILNKIGVNKVLWSIHYVHSQTTELVWNTLVSNSNKVIIPKNVLKSGSRFILRIKTNLSSIWSIHPFFTY